jgi:ferredoxin-NADP reductase
MMATAAWPTFQAALVGRELVAERTMAFRFPKSADWTYRAGQFVDITLLDPPETDAEGNTRGFSISSAPSEGVIMITTRLRDTAFKRVLQAMPLGTPVKIEGPFGDLRLHHAARPAVVLTGGIGITPFRSILIETIRAGGLPYRVVVLYANRRPQDAAFLDELRALAERDANFTFVPTMSGLDPSDTWEGERGHIDTSMLGRHLEGVTNAIYYLTGPPGMVQGLRTMLIDAGVDEDDIRTEEFTGY